MSAAGTTPGRILSVNVGQPKPTKAKGGLSSIDKRPVDGPVELAAPGPDGGVSGVAGDTICDAENHGGDDQAVYAYAREDLDRWQEELGRPLEGGVFGENLTTAGVDVSGARIGERWRVGGALLEVSVPRIPCGVFRAWMGERNWVSRFTERNAPGAYLRVIEPGAVRAGDEVTVVERPDHDVDVATVFAALSGRPDLLPRLAVATALPPAVLEMAATATGGDRSAS